MVSIDVDAVLCAIADERRRRIVGYLVEHGDEPVTIDELVDAATAADSAGPPDPPSRATIEWTVTRLHHTHLPKLDRAGVVEYDARSGIVRYRPDHRVEELIRFISDRFE